MRAPAKLNLHLTVGAVRPDGFHELTTVFQAVGLYDEVTVRRDDELTVKVTGVGADLVPLDATNLAARAVCLLAVQTGHDPRVAIAIHKGIPVAGGCAGGSADAAAALVGCDALWGCDWSRDRLAEAGAELGSDVPFALVGGTAMGTGRGDHVSPVLARGTYYWVLALAADGLSTPAVYAEYDRLNAGLRPPEPQVAPALMAALRAGDAAALGAALSNDLQDAAISLRPELARTLTVGEECGALGALVSGSGPTTAFLAGDEEHALDISFALTRSGTCADVVQAIGPVAGARPVGGG